MLRVPGSLNSKCKEAGIDPEVKIIQRWNGYRADYRLLLGSFYADLVGKNRELSKRFQSQNNNNTNGLPEPYIEKLLQTPITDYRKHARDLILVPYLVLRRRITNPEQICDIVMQWADRCAELRRLDPSRREFEHEVRTRVREVKHDRISHMSLERLKEKNPNLYKTIQVMLSGDI
jgi:hypothetical protein